MELAKRAVLEKLFDLLKRWDVEGVVNWSLHFVVDCAYDDGGVCALSVSLSAYGEDSQGRGAEFRNGCAKRPTALGGDVVRFQNDERSPRQ
ncbi:hypothetical protein AK812_SmicGene15647 [Symbiodinium microadriaticum]|uniref:Uncharacterized protein n=1 Tax=Symbiodinium microadriaticum TaxID=2951 RepID=A0A1Q9E2H1_SYMMI|nr:hypothetical protein AK812_SmicGene15647 [Symbiodinium microadriaticum]